MTKIIRTRFAPSPTGDVHIGNIRTALFKYLFAKKNGGEFLVRIEDTDRNRFVEGAEEGVLDVLRWVGLKWDGEVIRQSDRLPIYKEMAGKLVHEGKAYHCFCSKERLEELRAGQSKRGALIGYDGKCRNLSEEEVKEKINNGEEYVIRLKVPESGKVEFNDLVRGKVEFDYRQSDDQVLVKADGYPTYHLASIVDDHEQEITYVLRGEEWLSSTPKHIFLYECFGWDMPEFGHLPVIVGSDKKKLSKREGSVTMEEFRKQGYLPEALTNFMVLLGWNPGDDREFFSMEELVKEFDLKKVHKAPAVFDYDKLNHFNGYYIRNMSNEDLYSLLQDYSEKDFGEYDKDFVLRVIEVEKGRLERLSDYDDMVSYLFEDVECDKEMLKFKKSEWGDVAKGLGGAIEVLGSLDNWGSVEDLNGVLSGVVEKEGLSNGDVFWTVRVALSGKERSPSPGELLWALGKKQSLKRLNKAMENM